MLLAGLAGLRCLSLFYFACGTTEVVPLHILTGEVCAGSSVSHLERDEASGVVLAGAGGFAVPESFFWLLRHD